MTRPLFAALLALSALACQGNDSKPDIFVVVIETNIPDDARSTCTYRYEAESPTRTCGDALAPPTICSEIELCPAQVEWIWERFESCAIGEGSVDADELPACP